MIEIPRPAAALFQDRHADAHASMNAKARGDWKAILKPSGYCRVYRKSPKWNMSFGKLTVENGPFIVDLPIKHVEFP